MIQVLHIQMKMKIAMEMDKGPPLKELMEGKLVIKRAIISRTQLGAAIQSKQ